MLRQLWRGMATRCLAKSVLGLETLRGGASSVRVVERRYLVLVIRVAGVR